MASGKRLAVVLFNLGGPDGPDAVQPFLFNLFNDKAIISVPQPFRWLLAKLISTRRAPIAKEIYGEIGGRSPIVPLTQQQAAALEEHLNEKLDLNAEVFVCMRYWDPRAEQVVQEVAAFEPNQIVLLPLYPQFSTTTTRSSLKEWDKVARKVGLDVPTASLCCHPHQDKFISAHVRLLKSSLKSAGKNPRILFSAHGLPKKTVEAGDPYQWQVEVTAAAIIEKLILDEGMDAAALDWEVCYQSRVGPLEWIGPSTEEEIARAGADGKSLVIVPIAFVSEHSETLVELDIEYRALAEGLGVKKYIRVPALGADEGFIEGLGELVELALSRGTGLSSGVSSTKLCPSTYGQCPLEDVPVE